MDHWLTDLGKDCPASTTVPKCNGSCCSSRLSTKEAAASRLTGSKRRSSCGRRPSTKEATGRWKATKSRSDRGSSRHMLGTETMGSRNSFGEAFDCPTWLPTSWASLWRCKRTRSNRRSEIHSSKFLGDLEHFESNLAVLLAYSSKI